MDCDINQDAFDHFQPTYLYIKRHKDTGLMYFGKTYAKNDPYVYKGSGVYWKEHLRAHGDNIETIWADIFHSAEDILEFALFFSEEMDIVKSKQWANLKFESGLDGDVCVSRPHTESAKAEISRTLKDKSDEEWRSIIEKRKLTNSLKSDEEKQARLDKIRSTKAARTKEEKDMVREKRKNTMNNKTDEEKEEIRQKLKKKKSPRTQEHKDNLVASRRANNNYGHSQETREKLSRAHTGKKRSRESIEKRLETLRQRKLDNEIAKGM